VVVATVRWEDVEEIRLVVGGPWDEATKAAVERARARRVALQLLARCDRSRNQLRERLVRRGFDETIAAAVVSDLDAAGAIDEERHARQIAASSLRKGPMAASCLRARIEARGIEASVAQRAVEEALPESDTEGAERAAERLLDRSAPPPVAARRLAAALARRGFDAETIREVLERHRLI
jgi:regulatory protein